MHERRRARRFYACLFLKSEYRAPRRSLETGVGDARSRRHASKERGVHVTKRLWVLLGAFVVGGTAMWGWWALCLMIVRAEDLALDPASSAIAFLVGGIAGLWFSQALKRLAG